MRYVICDTDKAVAQGIDVSVSRKSRDGKRVILNENQLMWTAEWLTAEEMAERLEVKLLSLAEVKRLTIDF